MLFLFLLKLDGLQSGDFYDLQLLAIVFFQSNPHKNSKWLARDFQGNHFVSTKWIRIESCMVKIVIY